MFSPFHPSLARSIRDEQFELPSAVIVLLRDRASGNYMTFTEGSLDLVLDLCNDYWDGVELKPLDEGSKKKVMDLHQNALVNDGQCVAYAYGPVAPSEDLNTLLASYANQNHVYFEMETGQDTVMNRRLLDLVRGQVFLSLAALTHEPKEVSISIRSSRT